MTTALIGVEEVSGSVKQGASDVIVRHFDRRRFQHSRNGDVIGGIFGHQSSVGGSYTRDRSYRIDK